MGAQTLPHHGRPQSSRKTKPTTFETLIRRSAPGMSVPDTFSYRPRIPSITVRCYWSSRSLRRG